MALTISLNSVYLICYFYLSRRWLTYLLEKWNVSWVNSYFLSVNNFKNSFHDFVCRILIGSKGTIG